MILIFIEGIGVAAVAFMLTFFNAMVRELRQDRAPDIVERQKNCLERATPKRYQQQDRVASSPPTSRQWHRQFSTLFYLYPAIVPLFH